MVNQLQVRIKKLNCQEMSERDCPYWPKGSSPEVATDKNPEEAMLDSLAAPSVDLE
jgi:hypothetical protein